MKCVRAGLAPLGLQLMEQESNETIFMAQLSGNLQDERELFTFMFFRLISLHRCSILKKELLLTSSFGSSSDS